MTKQWTEEEITVLKKNYSTIPNKELTKKLDRSISAIKCKAHELKLLKNCARIDEITLNDFERGYIAAALDGEGSLGLYPSVGYRTRKKNRYIRIQMEFTNTNRDFLEKIRKIVGGHYCKIRTGALGKKPCYTLRLTSARRIYPILSQILPDLTVKKEVAKVIMAFCESRFNRENWKNSLTEKEWEMYLRVKELNGRGKKRDKR